MPHSLKVQTDSRLLRRRLTVVANRVAAIKPPIDNTDPIWEFSIDFFFGEAFLRFLDSLAKARDLHSMFLAITLPEKVSPSGLIIQKK